MFGDSGVEDQQLAVVGRRIEQSLGRLSSGGGEDLQRPGESGHVVVGRPGERVHALASQEVGRGGAVVIDAQGLRMRLGAPEGLDAVEAENRPSG